MTRQKLRNRTLYRQYPAKKNCTLAVQRILQLWIFLIQKSALSIKSYKVLKLVLEEKYLKEYQTFPLFR